MNLILFRSHEILDEGEARLQGERAKHVRHVLNGRSGDELRVGVVNEGTGVGVIRQVGAEHIDVDYTIESQPVLPPPTDLILAIPRPKVLRRVLQHIASLGVRRILLLNSWRVEKSYLKSPILQSDALIENLTVGLEQAGCASLPDIQVVDRFRPFVEDSLSAWCGDCDCLLFHPGADAPLSSRRCSADRRVVVAIGPEGGWIDFEVEALTNEGFEPIALGHPVLRVEVATVAALSGVNLCRSDSDI